MQDVIMEAGKITITETKKKLFSKELTNKESVVFIDRIKALTRVIFEDQLTSIIILTKDDDEVTIGGRYVKNIEEIYDYILGQRDKESGFKLFMLDLDSEDGETTEIFLEKTTLSRI